MKHLKRIVCLLVAVGAAAVLIAPPVGAKILPYQLDVISSDHQVRQPVMVAMYPDPQNVLPEQFRFEVRWARVRSNQTVASVAGRRGKGILMRQVGPHEYRGTFKPKSAGLFVVFSRTADPRNETVGYPEPIPLFVHG